MSAYRSDVVSRSAKITELRELPRRNRRLVASVEAEGSKLRSQGRSGGSSPRASVSVIADAQFEVTATHSSTKGEVLQEVDMTNARLSSDTVGIKVSFRSVVLAICAAAVLASGFGSGSPSASAYAT